MQYDNGVKLPRKTDWFGGEIQATPDGTLLTLVSRDVPGAGGIDRSIPQLAIRQPDGDWELVEIDDGKNFAAPRGYPMNRDGLGAHTLVNGPNGYVTFGSTDFWTSGFISATSLGIVHTSRDLRNWKRIDLRNVLGESRSVAWGELVATETGYLLAVATSNVAESTKSEIVVLTSADGTTWKKTATLRGSRWSVVPGNVYGIGGKLLLTGYEWACETDSRFFGSFNNGAMLRLWSSDNNGRTWTPHEVDARLFPSKEPNPTAATCKNVKNQFNELDQRFGTHGSIVGVANGTAVVHTGPGGSQAATSRDFKTWTIADLPGAIPADRTPEQFTNSGRDVVIPDAGGVTLLAIENGRKPDNSGSINGSQVLGWHTADGQSWTGYPLPMPVAATIFGLSVGTDGLVRFVDVLGTPPGQERGYVLYTSRAGPPIPYGGTCIPGPNANCRFTTLTDFDGRGLEAPGIDFTRARIDDSTFGLTPADFSGANMSGAQLPKASVTVTLTNANLAGINARDASFTGDLTGANLDGADLTLASVHGSFFAATFEGAILDGMAVLFDDGDSIENADLSGLDLEAVMFIGHDELVSMRNVNFADADLDHAGFHTVDLTGANFRGASVDQIGFGEDTICPSGKLAKKVDFRVTCGDLTP